MAKLRTTPDGATPLISDPKTVFFAGTDCVCAQVNANLLTRLQALAGEPKKSFYSEAHPASETRRRLLHMIEAHKWGNRGDYVLHSFIQEGSSAMRVAIAAPPVDTDRYCASFHLKPKNQLQDVGGFLIHIGELAVDTDHRSCTMRLPRVR
jgi:hypothetical protein